MINDEDNIALATVTGISVERLRELQSGHSKPTLEETDQLAKGLLSDTFNLNDLFNMAGIPPINTLT